MRTLVIGANGQLGRDLCPRLHGEVLPTTRAEIDLDRPETIASAIQSARPDRVVNCAAYNFVDKAETDPDAAFRSNAWGVRELARVCKELHCRLVHFSTDYVFGLDSKRFEPIPESEAPGPVSVYGLSKLAGEYFVRAGDSRNLVIRTCGLYGVWSSGGKGGNFVETMLRVAGQGKPLRVVDDQRCTPTATADLAATAVELIARDAVGLVHVTNAGDCTWFEFAVEIFRQAKVTADLAPISSEQFGAPARRPSYSVLASDQLSELGVHRPRPWQDALADYLKERESRRNA